MADQWAGGQNGGLPYYSPAPDQQPYQDGSQQQPYRAQRQPFVLSEALPYTPFTSIFPFESDIINTPTIGSGPLAPTVAGLLPRDDLNALNREASESSHSKRIEGSLDFIQTLLQADNITEFKFKTVPAPGAVSRPGSKSLASGLSPFTRLVFDQTSVSFSHAAPEVPKTPVVNGPNMSPKVLKKSPKARRPELSKVVKHNPASVSSNASSQGKSRIEIRLPTQRELEAGISAQRAPQRVSDPTHHLPLAAAQPQTVSLADLMMKPPSPPPMVSAHSFTSSDDITPQEPVAQTHTIPADTQEMKAELQDRVKVETISSDFKPAAPRHDHQDSQAQAVQTEIPNSIENTQARPSDDRATSLQGSGPDGFRIELPTAKFDRQEFAVVNDILDAPTYLSTKKGSKYNNDEDMLNSDLNQRDLANVAFSELQRCFQDIFAAENALGGQPGASSHLIMVTNDGDSMMTVAGHSRAHNQIKKTIELDCFKQAPVDDIIRIQNLSEVSIKYADSLDFKIDDSWTETEVGFWAQLLPDIEAGLKAARTALRVMCGGREEKQLYSEDLIHQSLNIFKNVMEGIVVPLAELRSTDNTGPLFKLVSVHRKAIGSLFTACQRLFSLMSDLIVNTDLSESVVNTLEYASSKLIFVENAYSEKDSVLGVQKFDGLRSVAMNMLSQIFVMNPNQRQGIFTEILTSLEKLPVGKQRARQFKLSEGGSIQPVSALIMRLVQASAGKVDNERGNRGSTVMNALREEEDQEGSGLPTAPIYAVRTEDVAAVQHSTAVQEISGLAEPLINAAARDANYVVNFIVERALKSTKSGDTPYRNLLDLFVEDFTTCLDSPDWPAAELLLRLLMFMMVKQVDGKENSAPARNMALELLGVMAAAISKLRSHVRKIAANFEGSDADELGFWLADLTTMALEGKISPDRILGWLGPYRIVLEFLQDRVTDDQYLRSAISYLVTDWAAQINVGYDSETAEDVHDRDSEYGRTAYRLRNMIEDSKWLSREYSFKQVAAKHARLAHSVILLRSSFCASFNVVLNILLGSMTTDQATVRSRSIKSINQVLETDPTILDGDSVVIQLILQCSSDSSPQVRDSALGLIGKCISVRPHLEGMMTPTVIQRCTDSGVGVRKRAMKLAKDIYLGNQSKEVRSTIANGLLHRMQDPDEGVRELAKQMVEEIWISPFYKSDESMESRQALTDHVALMVQTVKHGNSAPVLDKVLQIILSPESKLASANAKVCKRLVGSMFDLLDNTESEDNSTPSGKDALQVLVIFAKADPRLFTFEQIKLLKPHIASVSTSDDLAVARAVVVIYRRVLPEVSSINSQFLADVRKDLMPAVSKVGRALLDDVIACLWIMSGLLQTSEHLARLVSSSLAGIQKIRAFTAKGPLDQQKIRQFDRYSLIVGMAGKHCDLDSHADIFKSHFPKWQGGSVSKLMVDVLMFFAGPSQPLDIRRPALDAVGLVCQSNPRNYVSANVYTAFQQVFDEENQVLESMILRSLKEFLFTEERRSEQSAANAANGKDQPKKDLKVMGGTSFDDVASATTQRFLKHLTRIALSNPDDHAFLAMEVLATINRQGLVHPKETGITLMTLETSPHPKISELAYHEHRALHEKHETVLEREYVKAVQSAFQYQRDVIHDSRGATTDPFAPKLHQLVEVLKISKSKNRLRFLEKLVAQVDFELAKLDLADSIPQHVEYSRFILENMAFFDFVTIGELQATVAAMEKLFTGTGASIAQLIEAEVLQVSMDNLTSSQQPAGGDAPVPAAFESPVPIERLRRLAAGSTVFMLLWEARTHLRRTYGVNASRRETKGKGGTKDLTKAPFKLPGATGDKFWEDVRNIMNGLESPRRMTEQCKAFVELLNVDKDFKVADEEEEDLEGDEDPQTPEAEDDDDDESGAMEGRGRKRKAGNTPSGRHKRARSERRA
ncbi:sister chromatid cohesion protein Mis4 [Microdochium bolleyi]|uniref:Sister chromatid cohesion protein n=1 Tax=Microdochium bolleyi TaxID=196109 RepID=A0A136JDT4_9PEZI|nr:sister chromatid cohesion protein Mis4 [Microdochium bolleyi]